MSALDPVHPNRPRYVSPDPLAFARYLKLHREKNGVSLRDLGDKLGLSHTSIKHTEDGTRPPLMLQYWDPLLNALPTMTHTGVRQSFILSTIGRLGLSDRDTLIALRALLDIPAPTPDEEKLGLAATLV